jgi:hypothetical protein
MDSEYAFKRESTVDYQRPSPMTYLPAEWRNLINLTIHVFLPVIAMGSQLAAVQFSAADIRTW